MSEINSIVDEFRNVHHGNAWHGPSLYEALAELSADQAAARPLPAAHSIWEIVNHLAGWENVWRRRLSGEATASEPEEGDFPEASQVSDAAWQSTLARLEEIHGSLLEMIGALTAEQLDTNLPGRDYTHRFLLRAGIRHHVYHTGQIALLRKAFKQE